MSTDYNFFKHVNDVKYLDFLITDPNNKPVDFNNIEHSFILELIADKNNY